MEIKECLNELLVQLFRSVNTIEENALKTGTYKNLTMNDMHVIEAIGIGNPKNMTTVAKALSVTTGTLTIAINALVKKEYVTRVRSEEDRRVVLVSLTDTGKKAFEQHRIFHENMINGIMEQLDTQESAVLATALTQVMKYFREQS